MTRWPGVVLGWAVAGMALPAQQAAPNPWEGTWQLDRAASHFVGFVVTITPLPHSYRFELEGTTVEVSNDGSDSATAPGRTTSFRRTAQREWVRVHKSNGKTLDTSRFTLAGDGRSFAIHTVATDDAGTPHTKVETFQREGPGTGIGGTWRSLSAGLNVSPVIEIAAAEKGGLRFTFPAEGLWFVTPLDGSRVPYGGEHAVSGVEVAVRREADRQLERTDFVKGAPYEKATDTLSPDGKQLTETSWHMGKPADRDVAVYRLR